VYQHTDYNQRKYLNITENPCPEVAYIPYLKSFILASVEFRAYISKVATVSTVLNGEVANNYTGVIVRDGLSYGRIHDL
jgi:hypothetical protein